VGRGGLATSGVTITYHGLAAHSAGAENGRNALQALIQTFNLIDSIRARMPNRSNINGIITAGGVASNIIPDYAQGRFTVRNATIGDLRIVVGMMRQVVKSIEALLGVTADFETGEVCAERYSNHVMDEVFKKHMEDLGETVRWPDPEAKIGSSDIGNVSLAMPAIHEYFKITDAKVPAHNAAFTAEAVKAPAHEGMLKAAKALAATGYDIMTDEALRSAIQAEFSRTVPHYETTELLEQ
jgi:metal-dependent amidase/aminoacylase/carboxypeptidase family protein